MAAGGDRKATVTLQEGASILLTTDEDFKDSSDEETMYVSYEELGTTVQPGGVS